MNLFLVLDCLPQTECRRRNLVLRKLDKQYFSDSQSKPASFSYIMEEVWIKGAQSRGGGGNERIFDEGGSGWNVK